MGEFEVKLTTEGMDFSGSMRIPGATYRLQFNRAFTFKQAAEVVEYLNELGITDCYASPLFKAGAESTHGYDICGFDQLNPNLGGREGFDRFSGRLRELGMGLLLDIVPNHMGNDTSNYWWRSVLEKGRASPYAAWFDIDWQPRQSEFRDKVLLPVLEDHYARVLESGKLRLVVEAGELAIAYHRRRFPLSPESYALVLKRLPLVPDPKQALAAAVEAFNGTPGEAGSFDQLHALLQQQHYRLAYWRVGSEEINYRRFFDVTELVSLRMELPEVFEAAHQLVFQLVEAGQVTGLRVDHPDGLWDPKQYFERLQAAAGARLASATSATETSPVPEPASACAKPGAAVAEARGNRDTRGPLYVVAEKILTGQEELPGDWRVQGTTGYEFLNRVNGLFINPAHRALLDQCYHEFLGCPSPVFAAMVRSSKRQVLQTSFVSELDGLAYRLKALAAKSRYGQDFTLRQIRDGLAEVIAALPVYRTYLTEHASEPTAAERASLVKAIQSIRSSETSVDSELLGFVERMLLLQFPPDLDAAGQQLGRAFLMRLQQLTGPVMAKGLEDTVFYRYHRLISLNDVGGDPDRFGVSMEEFHAFNSARAAAWPHTMLATATHDTKRGEDARARIDVLSEMPEEWRRAVCRWRELNAGRKTVVDGELAPEGNDEYLLYQTLVGAWPEEGGTGEQATPGGTPGAPAGGDACPTFAQRIGAYMLKAIREAKVRTSWSEPNPAYESAMQRFVEVVLGTASPNAFLAEFISFQRRVAFFGKLNSLSQVLLKLTAPGVPDIYQGTELWDLSLVDPDNRRPVDYQRRRRLLAELKEEWTRSQASGPEWLRQLLQESHTGQIKLYLTWRALQFRREHRRLFEGGTYVPLAAGGAKVEHVCAFARVLGEEAAVTVVPRLVLGLTEGAERPPFGRETWGDTVVLLPRAVPGRQWLNVLTQETFSPAIDGGGQSLPLGEVLARFPLALLKCVGA